jgi:hypothetical protein
MAKKARRNQEPPHFPAGRAHRKMMFTGYYDAVFDTFSQAATILEKVKRYNLSKSGPARIYFVDTLAHGRKYVIATESHFAAEAILRAVSTDYPQPVRLESYVRAMKLGNEIVELMRQLHELRLSKHALVLSGNDGSRELIATLTTAEATIWKQLHVKRLSLNKLREKLATHIELPFDEAVYREEQRTVFDPPPIYEA